MKLFGHTTRQQNTEFGLVLIMITAISAILSEHYLICLLTIIIFCLAIFLIPVIFSPFAALWYRLSRLLGMAGTSILLTLVYLIIVTPVGLLRRLFGKDPMQVRRFRRDTQSTLVDREHTYTKDDFIHTF